MTFDTILTIIFLVPVLPLYIYLKAVNVIW